MIQIYKVNHFQSISSVHTGMRCYLMPGASTPVKYQLLAVCVYIHILPVTHAKHSKKTPQQHTELQVQCVDLMLTNVIEGDPVKNGTQIHKAQGDRAGLVWYRVLNGNQCAYILIVIGLHSVTQEQKQI